MQYKMKLLVLFGVFFAVVVSEARFIKDSSEEADFTEALDCVVSEGLIDYSETIGEIMGSDKYPVDDVKFNKFFGCYWKSMGLIDEEGHLKEDNLKTYLQKVYSGGGKVTGMIKMMSENVVNGCKETKGEGYGQKAVKVQNCVLSYLS